MDTKIAKTSLDKVKTAALGVPEFTTVCCLTNYKNNRSK